jgi:hypothetical protein
MPLLLEQMISNPGSVWGAALRYVFCGAEIGDNPGSAIGAPTAWQLVLRLPREQFADLLTVITARQLAEVYVLLDGLSRGKGAVRSASFHTEPVPRECGEGIDCAEG